MPVAPADQLAKFVQSNDAYAERVIRAADKNGNGNLTRTEAKKLGDIKDTFDLYARKGKTVSTEEFIAFYKSYVHVEAQSGTLSADVQDNFDNWLALSMPANEAKFGEAAKAQAAALTDLVMDWRSDVADMYEWGDEDYVTADAQATQAFFAGATWVEVDVPGAYKAFKAVSTTPVDTLDELTALVLLDRHAKVVTIALQDSYDGSLYARDDVSDVFNTTAILSGDADRYRAAATVINDFINSHNVRNDFPVLWDDAFSSVHGDASGLSVVYDYEMFAGSHFTEDEHVEQMEAFMTALIKDTPELAQFKDMPVTFFGPWGT